MRSYNLFLALALLFSSSAFAKFEKCTQPDKLSVTCDVDYGTAKSQTYSRKSSAASAVNFREVAQKFLVTGADNVVDVGTLTFAEKRILTKSIQDVRMEGHRGTDREIVQILL
jgi:hypothetical protein